MDDVIVKALQGVIVYGDFQGNKYMAVELQQGQVF